MAKRSERSLPDQLMTRPKPSDPSQRCCSAGLVCLSKRLSLPVLQYLCGRVAGIVERAGEGGGLSSAWIAMLPSFRETFTVTVVQTGSHFTKCFFQRRPKTSGGMIRQAADVFFFFSERKVDKQEGL